MKANLVKEGDKEKFDELVCSILGKCGVEMYNPNISSINELWDFIQSEKTKSFKDGMQEAYLQCLAVECGEGECAIAIKTKLQMLKKDEQPKQ